MIKYICDICGQEAKSEIEYILPPWSFRKAHLCRKCSSELSCQIGAMTRRKRKENKNETMGR